MDVVFAGLSHMCTQPLTILLMISASMHVDSCELSRFVGPIFAVVITRRALLGLSVFRLNLPGSKAVAQRTKLLQLCNSCNLQPTGQQQDNRSELCIRCLAVQLDHGSSPTLVVQCRHHSQLLRARFSHALSSAISIVLTNA